jgi:2-octaprenylphenol hydroxylase
MSIKSISIDAQVTIESSQQTITCDLIIGADGANSWLRDQLDWPLKTHDYQHHALVTTVKSELAHAQTAWQHFLSDGPLAFLPLENPQYCSVVWSSTPEKIASLKNMNESDFNQAITIAMQEKLGQVQTTAPRVSFPFAMQHLESYVQDHIAFIGDAAHRIHPLAGQGVNLGFMDAKCLADTIETALTKNKNFTTKKSLSAYQRERKYYNGQMITLMQGIKDLFTNQTPSISTLRNFGMETINKFPPVKNFLIKQALGL